MQQFTVPQFIDVEDKILGPITTRQFIIMMTGCIVVAIFYKIFDFSLFVTSAFLTLGIFGIVAFLKINGMPFHFFVLNFIQTSKKPKLRVWSNAFFDPGGIMEENISKAEPPPKAPDKIFNSSRLTELSLIVDTRGAYQGEEK